MALMLARNWLVKPSVLRLVSGCGHSVRPESSKSGIPKEQETPVYVSEEYKNVFPDPVESATGYEKKQLLALLQGDMRYEPKLYKRGPGTKDNPNIVPSHEESRIVGCLCEPDQLYLNFMMINLGEMKRCECGFWYKCVPSDPEFF